MPWKCGICATHTLARSIVIHRAYTVYMGRLAAKHPTPTTSFPIVFVAGQSKENGTLYRLNRFSYFWYYFLYILRAFCNIVLVVAVASYIHRPGHYVERVQTLIRSRVHSFHEFTISSWPPRRPAYALHLHVPCVFNMIFASKFWFNIFIYLATASAAAAADAALLPNADIGLLFFWFLLFSGAADQDLIKEENRKKNCTQTRAVRQQ